MDAAVADGNHIGVSAISVAEMVYLIEKGRIPATALTDVQAAVAHPNAVLRYMPVDQHIATNMAAIPREDVPDLPDRIIAATAHWYGIPVLTRDGRIRSSNVRAIW
jgi:PIN domain nuclease of toxin-antitoxin system